VDQVYTEIRFCVADLQPGFIVITDLSRARLGHLSGIRSFKNVMQFLLDRQVGQVIRVVTKESIILAQLLRISSAVQGYSPIYVHSLEEAHAKIAELQGPAAA
jgi:hypothetical protein